MCRAPTDGLQKVTAHLIKNKPSFYEKRHVILWKTTYRFMENKPLFLGQLWLIENEGLRDWLLAGKECFVPLRWREQRQAGYQDECVACRSLALGHGIQRLGSFVLRLWCVRLG